MGAFFVGGDVARVLLVAPFHADLRAAQVEAFGVAQALGDGVRVLPPDVDEGDVLAAVEDGPFGGLWLATHGTAEGVLLADGRLLSVDGLAQLVRATSILEIFLNSCDGVDVALQLHAATGATVVAHDGALPDGEARWRGVLLARLWRDTGSLEEAFYGTRGTRSDGYFIVPDGGRNRVVEVGRSRAGGFPDGGSADYAGLRRDVDRLVALLDGDEELGLEGLRAKVEQQSVDIRALTAQVGELSKSLEGMGRRLAVQGWLMVGIGGLGVLVAIVAVAYGLSQ